MLLARIVACYDGPLIESWARSVDKPIDPTTDAGTEGEFVSGSRIKVTDKRKFTPEGDLREEYRSRSTEATTEEASPDVDPGSLAAASGPAPPQRPSQGPELRRGRAEAEPRSVDDPSSSVEASLDQPSFYDLVSALAQPAALYLGEVEAPGGGPRQDFRLARVYIDLLAVLQRTTAGNLSADESRLLEETLSQLRLLYVQKQS